jgi:hypothetical protein
VTWSAVGDDGRCGQAKAYDLRVSDRPITDATFDAATRLAVPAPRAAGSREEYDLRLPPRAKYVAVHVYDADPTKDTPVAPANLSALAAAPITGLAPDEAVGGTHVGAPGLPATGPSALLPTTAALLLATVAVRRRRRA